MKHLANLSFFCLFLLCICTEASGQRDWTKFRADDVVAFTIDVPGEMEKTTKTIKTAVGELDTYTYAYQASDDDPNYLYLINVVQYPEATFPVDSIDLIDEYLDNTILTSAQRVDGAVVYSSDLDDKQGKLFRIKYNDGNAVIKGKSFIVADAFINIQVFTVQTKSLNREMDYFLDSFKVSQ